MPHREVSYQPGDVVAEQDYQHISNAWIMPDGNMIFVYFCGHESVAGRLWYMTVDAAEKRGYIHLSDYAFVGGYEYTKPTPAQLDTVLMYCAALPRAIPAWATMPDEETAYKAESRSGISNTYTTTLRNRKQRDMFYPLSGD